MVNGDQAFRYVGTYRHQSSPARTESILAGHWLTDTNERLSSGIINEALHRSPLWMGTADVRLRAAAISERGGAFASAADALYHRSFFRPAPGHDPMSDDIVDVTKLLDHWVHRRPHTARLVGHGAHQRLEAYVGDVRMAAANEYFCHEAGHATGWDVGSKYDTGYFRITGTLSWPLIYVEEFRADLLSLTFACEILPRTGAIAVFAYHLLHRFGLAEYSARTGEDGAGAVPYLLFCLLLDLGVLKVGSVAGEIAVAEDVLEQETLLALMRACGAHAIDELTVTELRGATPEDVAINAARYFRHRVTNDERTRQYAAWIRANAASGNKRGRPSAHSSEEVANQPPAGDRRTS